MTETDGAPIVEGIKYAANVGPGLSVTGTLVLGLPLSEWVYIVTIFYTLLQTGYFVWKLVHKEKQKIIKEVEDAKDGS